MTFTKFTHTLLKHHQTSWRPSMECTKHEKENFGFVEKFVKSSKSETQLDIHKMYPHIIETPPSKLEAQHGVSIM